MSWLLDTNAWIGFFEGEANFGKRAQARMEESPERCWVSIASIWEASIKLGLGKLRLPYDIEHDLPALLADNGFRIMGIEFEEATAVCRLPRHHGDPFDRIMAAQAQHRHLAVISSDRIFEAYGLERIW